MKKIVIAFLLFFSCLPASKVVTINDFYEVNLGESKEELEARLGKPYSVQKVNEKEEIYEYIEKISTSDRILEERHYFFTLRDKKIVSKDMKTITIPPFKRNSYDMQTSEHF